MGGDGSAAMSKSNYRASGLVHRPNPVFGNRDALKLTY